MTALTIRQIPFPVEKAIRRKAAREHVSLNKAVVGMLEESVIGKQKTPSLRYHDFRLAIRDLEQKAGRRL